MRKTAILAALLLVAAAAPAGAVPDGWHSSLDDGLKASGRSGKPLLVVTAWREGV